MRFFNNNNLIKLSVFFVFFSCAHTKHKQHLDKLHLPKNIETFSLTQILKNHFYVVEAGRSRSRATNGGSAFQSCSPRSLNELILNHDWQSRPVFFFRYIPKKNQKKLGTPNPEQKK